MRKHYATLAGTTFALTVAAAGIALGQYNPAAPPRLIGRPDPELKAARQSLDDALAHLARARNAGSDEVARVRGCIEVAESHIDPAFDSFSAGVVPLPSPNSPKPTCG